MKGKPAKNAAPVAKTKAPRGMVVNILKHASRPKGVTPDELNTLTKWKGAPWKWLFSNPKKNGYCDRWNTDRPQAGQGQPRAVAYHVKAK